MVPTRAGAEVVLLRAGAEVASWPLVCAHGLDLSLVDTLARLLMEARRHGCSIRLRNACTELTALLELVGVTEVLQVGGEAERGEEGGVEELWCPTILSPDISMTWMDHGAWPPFGSRL